MMRRIDTAPRDGTVIEISRHDADPETVYWDSFYWCSISTGNTYEETDYWPTHWRHRPSSETSLVLQ